MGVTHLKQWHVTALEVALDLEMPRFVDPSRFAFSGPAEPRICLVASFVLTSQLKHVLAAIDRVIPARPISGLRIRPAAARSPTAPAAPIAIQPMSALLRLQSKLIHAIEPGLANDGASGRAQRSMDDAAAQFIGDFISHKALPTFEPPRAPADFEETALRVIGLTIYRLGDHGTPESILSHWPYPPDPGSIPFLGGP
jgi:hypothetical protein